MRRTILRAALMLGLSTLAIGEARAGFTTVVGSSDANLTDPNLSGTFTGLNTTSPSTYGLVIQRYTNLGPQFNAETRAVIEFNLAAIHANSTINGLTFNFQEFSSTSSPGQLVGIYGYAGTGTIGLSDATTAATLLGTYNPTAFGSGDHSVTLSGSNLDSLVGNSGFLAIRLQGIGAYENTANESLEGAAFLPQFIHPPTLSVSFAPVSVPEPSSLVLLCGMGSAAAIGIARKRRRS